VSASDRLGKGDRCMATISAGLRPQRKKAVVTEVLPSGYKVRCDGEEGERRLSEKKVKRVGKPAKKVAPVTGETEGWIATIRDQRPPTRLHIPDANVPTVEPGTPTVLRSGQPDRPVIQLQADSLAAFGIWEHRSQPKPRKPSRSAAYLQHVRQHDCCNCGAFGPSDPDHVGPRGVGQKTSDYNCIPLCRACHRRRTDKNVLPEADKNFGGPAFDRTRSDTELIILRAQVQMLREWAEKIEKETP